MTTARGGDLPASAPPAHFRLLPRAAAHAAAIALTSMVMLHPATAGADPTEWDIGAYDACMKAPPAPNSPWGQEGKDEQTFRCCINSGGVASGDDNGENVKCSAPAALGLVPQQPPSIPHRPPGQAVPIPSTAQQAQ